MAGTPTTLRERAAQLIFPRLGSNMPPPVAAERDVRRIAEMLAEVPVGGVVLFRGDARRTPDALRRLQRESPFPLLVAADLERGAGQQMAGGTVLPHAMAYAGAGDGAPAMVHHLAWLTAREALSYGIHWMFAPVADVHSNPANPIISTRAFSSDPLIAAELVQAFVSGCREGGVYATAKHFPGHGDTDTDSHETVPSVSRSRAALDEVELVPFRAAIAAGVSSVMTAHVAYPALDPSGRIATRSAPILRDLLRGELGFEGVVVSDSLLMAGAGTEAARQAPELVAAGIDVLLDLEHPALAVDHLVRAVEEGTLPEETLDEAFRRVWRLKDRLVERHGPDVFTAPPPAGSAPAEAAELAESIAEAAIRESGYIPDEWLRAALERGVHVLVFRPIPDYPDPTLSPAEEIFRELVPGATVDTVGPELSPDEAARLVERARSRGVVVCALVVKPAAWHRFGLRPDQLALVRRLEADAPVLPCSLGSPDVLDHLEDGPYRMCALSDVSPSVRAAARRIAARLELD
jgi:beta-glucosidase-like glycosyl hydrolase